MKALMTNKDARILICETKEGTLSWSLNCEVPTESENHGRKDQILRNLPFPGWCRKAIDAGQWVDISAVEVAELKVPAGRRRDFHVVVRGKVVTPKKETTVFTPRKWFWEAEDKVVSAHTETTVLSYGDFEKVVKKETVTDDEYSVAEEHAGAKEHAKAMNPTDPDPTWAWAWCPKRAPMLEEHVEYGEKYLQAKEDAVELKQKATVVKKYGEYSWSFPRKPCEGNAWHWDVETIHYQEKTVKDEDPKLDKVLKVVPKSELDRRVEVKEVYKPCRMAGGYYFHDVFLDGKQVAHIEAGAYNPHMAGYHRSGWDMDGDPIYTYHDGKCKYDFRWAKFPIDVFEKEF